MKLIAACIASVASLSSACVSDLDEEDVSQTEQFVRPICDEWGCGMNSPYIDNFGFHALLLDGSVGEQGFQIWKFEKGGVEYHLEVVNGEIIGTRAGSLPLRTTAVEGARIHLLQRGVPSWEILISDVTRASGWAERNGNPVGVMVYELQWAQPGMPDGKFQNICSGSDTEGLPRYHAVVFEGDVIDSRRKRVSDQIDRNVVNIGCAGSTLAKMALMGHTEAAEIQGFVTTARERQTLLKMFSADYCGTGRPFTVGGQPLQYSDHRNWISAAMISTSEALWDENGAVCLNTPRVIANPTEESTLYFSDVEDQISTACNPNNSLHPTRPPPCPAGTSAYQPTSPYHMVSANRQLIYIPL